MVNEGDFNAASTTNVRLDGGKKSRKENKHHKSSKEMSPLTSQPERSGSQGLRRQGKPWRY
ncbi:hypothetical protein H5410_037912 [Solanum commersonii]|uniref:Uncharacterized protein n=1 Tax=Solanum commersonii TaxID=4109 RepID=A0A9J5YAU9_SOLCO|nr:hypothetical protein H5410_037912 [Solanum commersonii]